MGRPWWYFEYWNKLSWRQERKMRTSCPYCGNNRTYYNAHYKTWKCLVCEKSFIVHGLPYTGKGQLGRRVVRPVKDEFAEHRERMRQAKGTKFSEPMRTRSFKHLRKPTTSRHERKLHYYRNRITYWFKRKLRKTRWHNRNLAKILILLAVLATIAVVLSAVGLSISGDVSLVAGIVISVVGLAILLWSLKTLSKYRPRLTSTVMVLFISLIFIMFSSAYLDIRSFNDVWKSISGAFTTEEGEFRENVEAFIERVELIFVEVTEDIIEEIEEVADTNYVYVDGGVIVGADGHYITLINNPDATNPTWGGLKSFLASDDTDRQTYSYTSFVCADFAEMLHNNAEATGIRSAYVTIRLGPISYYTISGGHALNAFQTTDRGLVYIDCTAPIVNYSGSADKIVNVEVGKPYIPESVFPHGAWRWLSMGVVEDIEVMQW